MTRVVAAKSSRRPAWSVSMQRVCRGVAIAGLLGCGGAESGPGPAPAVAANPGPAPAPAPAAAPARCEAAAGLDGVAWLPGDLRLAVILDLGHTALPQALAVVQAAARADRFPVVASLGLGQLGLQLGLLRPQLAAVGLAPQELAWVHDRDGAVIWILRAPCDFEDLAAAVAQTWSLRVRRLADGAVAEVDPTGPGPRVAFEVAFLAEDRMALVPVGSASRLRHWLSGGGSKADEVSVGETFKALPQAPVRGVWSGRGFAGVGGSSPTLGETAPVHGFWADGDRVVIDGAE